MKPVKNFSNAVDVNKLGIPNIPTPSSSDAGKILGVDINGKYALGDDQGTVLPVPTAEDNGKVIVVDNAAYALGDADSVEANPAGSATERLYKIGINDTIYRVNDDETVTTVKAVKITFDTIQGTDGNVVFQAPFTFVNGTTHEVYQYSVNDTIEASNGGNFDYMIDNASSWGYTVPVANLPLSFIIHIPAGIDITQYNEIYFVSGVYTNPSPKHVTVDVSVNDGTDFINVIDNSDVGYTYHSAIKIGEFANAPAAVLPTVTTSDNGDVLTVVNGVWDKAAPVTSNAEIVTLNTTTNTADKTAAQVKTAIAEGKEVFLRLNSTAIYIPFSDVTGISVIFERQFVDMGDYLQKTVYTLDNSGDVDSETYTFNKKANIGTIKNNGADVGKITGFGKSSINYLTFADIYKAVAENPSNVVIKRGDSTTTSIYIDESGYPTITVIFYNYDSTTQKTVPEIYVARATSYSSNETAVFTLQS